MRASWTDRVCVAVATCLHLSYIPHRLFSGTRSAAERRWTGAGFVGTAAGWVTVYALPEGGWRLAAALLAGIAAACFVSHRAELCLGRKDDPRIVADELVGFWAAAAWLPRSPGTLLAAFVLFRIFDVLKLPGIRSLERLPGGLGVVADDVGAGAAANLVLRGMLLLGPRLMG